MAFTLKPLELPGLVLVESRVFPDDRGYFLETFRERDLKEAGIGPFVQDNVSRSSRGTLRGLHYQKLPAAQGKLVRCLRGKIFDVAVDMRRGSPAYGRWTSVELDDVQGRALWVPAGFAHGFYTMSDWADVHYKVTDYYSPGHDAGVIWNDPALAIRWPSSDVTLSPKDLKYPPFAQADNNFTWS